MCLMTVELSARCRCNLRAVAASDFDRAIGCRRWPMFDQTTIANMTTL